LPAFSAETSHKNAANATLGWAFWEYARGGRKRTALLIALRHSPINTTGSVCRTSPLLQAFFELPNLPLELLQAFLQTLRARFELLYNTLEVPHLSLDVLNLPFEVLQCTLEVQNLTLKALKYTLEAPEQPFEAPSADVE
jgi:hypothetical protein